MQLTVEESKLKVDSVSSMIATHMGREKSSSATTSASLHYICGAIANIQGIVKVFVNNLVNY